MFVSLQQFSDERCNLTFDFDYCHDVVSVCRLSATRMYCNKIFEEDHAVSPKTSLVPHLYAR